MKRTFLLKMMLLLCALVAGSSSVWATDYVKITSTDELVAGGEYLIVNTAGTYAAGATSTTSTKYATTVSVTTSLNTITDPDNKVAVYTLGGNAQGWTFYSSKDSKYLYWGSGNSLNVNATVSNNTKWTVSISNGDATIANVNTSTRVIRFNSDRFACYTTTTGTLVSIYKKVLPEPTITFNNGSTRVGKTLDLSTLFTSNSTGAVTYSITEGGSYATLDGSMLTGTVAGSVTVQASQAATNSYSAKTVTATITINAAKTLSSIAITTAPTKTTYIEGELFDATGMVVTATYSDSSIDDVTTLCTWTPNGALTLSDTEITISYTENNTTKTATQAITVNPYVQPTNVTINLSNTMFGISAGGNSDEQSTSVNNIIIKTGCESSAQNKTYYASDHIRFYTDSYLILEAPTGYVITGIQLNCYDADKKWNGDKVTPSTGAFDGIPEADTAPLVWSGIATSVRFDYSAQCRTASVDVTLAKVENVTITTATWASFSCDKALDFTGTGVTAYIAKVKDDSNVTLTEITKVPANTGIVVNAPAETYAIPVLSGDADDTTGNLLKPWLTAGDPTETTYYTLAVSGGEPVFYTSTGGELAANKAYLVMPGNSTAPSLGVFFGGTTGMNDVRSKTEEVRGDFYNLNGQRVAQPTKGLYIVNGKKYIVK